MKTACATAVLCLFALPTLAAQAAPPVAVHAMVAVDGNKILAEVDRRAAAFDDQSYTAQMAINKGGKLQKTLKFRAVMKGLEQQLIEFVAPGDVAGMKVLMQNADTLYVYMPEFNKVRRVAAHVQSQGFLGSEFTYEDMTQTQLAPFFNAELQGKEGSNTTLVLTPKQSVETTYAKLEVVIDGAKGGVTTIRYFDKSGKQVREQQRGAWKKIDGKPRPTEIRMVNLKSGDVTVITMSDIAVDKGVDDSTFSRRQLLRG